MVGGPWSGITRRSGHARLCRTARPPEIPALAIFMGVIHGVVWHRPQILKSLVRAALCLWPPRLSLPRVFSEQKHGFVPAGRRHSRARVNVLRGTLENSAQQHRHLPRTAPAWCVWSRRRCHHESRESFPPQTPDSSSRSSLPSKGNRNSQSMIDTELTTGSEDASPYRTACWIRYYSGSRPWCSL